MCDGFKLVEKVSGPLFCLCGKEMGDGAFWGLGV